MSTPKGFDLLPDPMKGVLTMLGESGTIHLETERIMVFGGASDVHMFNITVHYDVPPVSLVLTGRGTSLEQACGDVTWQFLENIGMGPAE